MKRVGIIVITFLLAACTPTMEEGEKTPALSAAEVAVSPTAVMGTNTAVSATNTAQPTTTAPLPTLTPPPSLTPSPTRPTSTPPSPTQTPLPTPLPSATPSVYTDIWVSGHLEEQYGVLGLKVAESEDGQFWERLTLEISDENMAAEITADFPYRILFLFTGDLYPSPVPPHRFVVKEMQLLDAIYTPETPLDVTYTHHDPNIQIDYPSVLNFSEYDHGGFRVSSWLPNTILYRPGVCDFPQVAATVEIVAAESVEAYVNEVLETPVEYAPHEVTYPQVGSWATTRVITHDLGSWVHYVVDVDGKVVVFRGESGSIPFIERILATMRQNE